jgi:hypothetical protein
MERTAARTEALYHEILAEASPAFGAPRDRPVQTGSPRGSAEGRG